MPVLRLQLLPNLGSKLYWTMSLQNIAQMSCNPAMGGIAKGQIVREIDAGGYSNCLQNCNPVQDAEQI
jgi:tRNA uridine 5-carboxymethylaminomethyl modification enzyme